MKLLEAKRLNFLERAPRNFFVWKKAYIGKKAVLVKMKITKGTKIRCGHGSPGVGGDRISDYKCRAEKANVVSLFYRDGTKLRKDQIAHSHYSSGFGYKAGQTVECCLPFCNTWNVCASGIHFFISKDHALRYRFQ